MLPLSYLRLKGRPPEKRPPPKNFVDLFMDPETGKIHAHNSSDEEVYFNSENGSNLLGLNNTWTGSNTFTLGGSLAFLVSTTDGNIELGVNGSGNLALATETGQTLISSGVTGSINNMAIGGSVPSTGVFTTITLPGGAVITGTGGHASVAGSASPGWDMRRTTAGTASIAVASRLTAISTGDAADGFGPALEFRISDTGVSDSLLGSINFVRAGADSTGDFVIRPLVAGSAAERLRVTSTGSIVGSEQASPPAAPAANGYTIFAEDNGAGKTRLMVRFATGAAVQIAIEP